MKGKEEFTQQFFFVENYIFKSEHKKVANLEGFGYRFENILFLDLKDGLKSIW